ncbi:MAG: pyruvate ferredoxin oxidoreductase [Candidatus Riflebacteria bacterium]|nr:pyruvate ferredoxin oxidoreductase [Candidatus Riflebacteria bacterium]
MEQKEIQVQPVDLKKLTEKPTLFTGGHRACAGCGMTIMARQVLLAASDNPVVVGCATGCLEVTTTIYPYTAWNVPFIHNAFENAAATVSGVETAFRALKKKGRIPPDKKINFITFGGDGGTYDIGIQSLSGAMERGHRMLYICYDNGAYMNTGIQRSGATPRGAHTTTCPVGTIVPGKPQKRKDLAAIMSAHNIPYVATASPHQPRDLMKKVRKALAVDGPSFMLVFSPCRLGWAFPPEQAMELSREAVSSGFWPLYEVEYGKLIINEPSKDANLAPIKPWLEKQGRFKHLFQKGNEGLLNQIQEDINHEWESLKKRTTM